MKQKTVYRTTIGSAISGGLKVWSDIKSNENTLEMWERNLLRKSNIRVVSGK
jgi:hypothetical protein